MTDNERTERERVEVTQADRIAAAPMAVLAEMRDLILAGKADHYAKPFARHREQARREALEDAVREVEAWFPCGTIDKPEFGAGKALREAIRKLKGD